MKLFSRGRETRTPNCGFGDRCFTIETMPLFIYLDTSCTFKTSYKTLSHLFHLPSFGQSLDRLVTVSSMCCHTSTSALSTSSSSRGLTTLQYGKSYLWGGFTLRCLQRLSLPDLATLLCTWQYNRYTSGPSIPVLSY